MTYDQWKLQSDREEECESPCRYRILKAELAILQDGTHHLQLELDQYGTEPDRVDAIRRRVQHLLKEQLQKLDDVERDE